MNANVLLCASDDPQLRSTQLTYCVRVKKRDPQQDLFISRHKEKLQLSYALMSDFLIRKSLVVCFFAIRCQQDYYSYYTAHFANDPPLKKECCILFYFSPIILSVKFLKTAMIS